MPFLQLMNVMAISMKYCHKLLFWRLAAHLQHVSGIIFVIRCKTNIASQLNIEAVNDAYNDLRIEKDTTFFSSAHTSSLFNK